MRCVTGSPPPTRPAFTNTIYQAVEDNELSLVEGELIVQTVQEDTDWWSGTSADGTRSGLFPAAYVALIEAPAETDPKLEPEADAPPPPPPPPLAAPAIPAVPEPEPEPAPGGVIAIALYE
ncbi:hypothetical protein BJV78DRAFT_419620 [Lactifluus subvellereus]|nr:hypothetical protein BJV78DRAFT_419620 [Lactifluus subvellereus]